ncbi:hypothetical protein L6164_004786 [Bauhinia variegata]|uniref:Uncharacterized protein n=1 Tax=Bauhinia variegata TaxID=167791 RepID=A0ACB9PQL1_BAUVA|nr:hypothetical protein L6164_004786 [Bauhinia variegata]
MVEKTTISFVNENNEMSVYEIAGFLNVWLKKGLACGGLKNDYSQALEDLIFEPRIQADFFTHPKGF